LESLKQHSFNPAVKAATENDVLKIDLRRKRIIEAITRDGMVKVTQLSKLLDTSEVTIRSDLSKLEKDGLLERVSGGAVINRNNYYNMVFHNKKRERAEEKQSIAAEVANIIQDGDTLIINSGSTTYFIAMELKRYKNLNIVTNSVYVAMELGIVPTFRIILLGGEINTQYYFSYGNDAMLQLGKYMADKTILSVDGVTAEAGITTYHPEETAVNKMMIEQSRQTIIAADYTKIGHVSFSHIADISQIDVCVTNKTADPKLLSEIAGHNVEIITC